METHVDETGSFEVFGSSYSFCDLGVVVSDLHLSDEWTSVTNVSSEPSCIAGFQLDDGDGHVFTFPEGFHIAARGSVTVFSW